MEGQIYSLIGKAMEDIGAIGKNDYNPQQKFKYRGIDAVYNALNPVMRKYGLFIAPEVLNHTREERTTKTGGNLIYSILTMKYTMYAPDGSSISCVVIGEGMDSGDKASNKAMSVAMKYAMFQLFCIPTEEFVDPDAETPPESVPKEKPKDIIERYCDEVNMTSGEFGQYKSKLVDEKLFPKVAFKDMTEEQKVQLIGLVEQRRTA